MGSTLFSAIDPQKICLDGLGNLLLHEKTLLRQVLDCYNPEAIPDQLVIPLNQINTLSNSALSGLKLPELMIRETLRDINSTLSDHTMFNNAKEMTHGR